MELKGKIVSLLDGQTGEGKNGTWKKQDYILETASDKYPKKVCFSVWNEKIEEFALKVGDEVRAVIEIESREFNGKWYTNVQCSMIKKDDDTATPPPAATNDNLPF